MILGYNFVEERLFAVPAAFASLGKKGKVLSGRVPVPHMRTPLKNLGKRGKELGVSGNSNVPRINTPSVPLASAQNTTNRALGNRLRNAEKAMGGELRRASNLGAKKPNTPPQFVKQLPRIERKSLGQFKGIDNTSKLQLLWK